VSKPDDSVLDTSFQKKNQRFLVVDWLYKANFKGFFMAIESWVVLRLCDTISAAEAEK